MLFSPGDLPPSGSGIPAALNHWAHSRPDVRALGFLGEGDAEPSFVSYSELNYRAAVLATRLRVLGNPGERAIILHNPGLDYVVAFLACLRAGIVAVPAYPPRGRRGLDRLRRQVADAACTMALTSTRIAAHLGHRDALAADLTLVTEDDGDRCYGPMQETIKPNPDDVAYLQYTSGSTRAPRGVMVKHGNLERNILAIADSFSLRAESRGVIWLPPYHDMGLIGGILTPLYCGFPCLLMTPAVVIRQPVIWLRWITRLGATVSGGPDFAYRHAMRTVTAEQKRDLDLSTWEVAFCGAEPIKASTLDGFAEAFAGCGFRRESYLPCYGLAEATLIVSGSTRRRGPESIALDPEALSEGTANPRPDGKRVVNCGPIVAQTRVVVVDDLKRVLPEDRIGEILVSGPSVCSGYHGTNDSAGTAFGVRLADESGDEAYLRTGDLGFLRDGELFVTGRLKELIIIRGRKFHPHDIEEVVETIFAGIRPSNIAAFATETVDGTIAGVAIELERLRLKEGESEFAAIAKSVREEVGGVLDVTVGPVIFLKPGGLPRTSSGKLQRSLCGAMFADDCLDAVFVDNAATPPAASRPSPTVLRFPLADGRAACTAAVEAILVEIGAPTQSGVLTLDSLKLVQFSALAERDFGLQVTATDLFAAETVDDLTTLLSNASIAPAARRTVTTTLRERVASLSSGQRGLWFIDSLTGASAAYNTPFAARIEGHLDLDSLRHAVEGCCRRHAALRVIFREEENGPIQIDADSATIAWHTVDASGWTEERLADAIAAVAATPFLLQTDRPLRCHVFRRDPDDHIVLIVTHHIRVDFWSFQLMLGDLLQDGGADVAQKTSKPPGHYFDFVQWQLEYLQSDRADADLAYWRSALTDLPSLALPLDRPTAANGFCVGEALPVTVDPVLRTRLGEFCRERGYTTGMVILAAYGLLLESLSGQNEVVVGVPFSGRTRADFFDTVGYFVNPLPQRIMTHEDDTVATFLDRVRDTMLGALDHQDYPSVLMAREVQGPRALDGNTLFQTMMVLNQPHRLLENGDLTRGTEGTKAVSRNGLVWTERPLPQQFTKFDLVLAGLETAESLEFSLQFRPAVLDRDTVARFATALTRILGQLVAPGDLPLSALDPLSAEERLRIGRFETGPGRDWDLDRPIHRRVEMQAKETPDAVACVYGTSRLTYRQVNVRANAVAAGLRSLGADRGRFVGVLVDRCLALPVSWLGVMKSGAAFVPLDPEWPIERLHRVAKQCDVLTIVATPDQARLAEAIGRGVLTIGDATDGDYLDPRVDMSPDDPIYAFCTSGSTGEPKCAAIPHRGITNRFAWMDEFFGPTTAWRVLQTTRQVYDSAVWQLFWPLVNGGATVIPLAGQPLEAATVLALVASESITMTDFVPSVFNLVVEEIGDSASTRRALRSLSTVILGGEEINPETTRTFMARFPSIRVVNLYGPTEASIGCIACDVDSAGGGRISIGRPIANVRVRIVDRRGNPVPVGTIGEIVIGGPAVGLGYVGDVQATRRAFFRDPETGRLTYRTGDLARWMPDGSIDFRGRRDNQVKIRGHRIELGEIEIAMRSHPAVAAAVVTVHLAPSGARQLVAYAVGSEGRPAPEAILAGLRSQLPGWMVPVHVVVLDELPLTPGGKIDRTRLPVPQAHRRRPPESDTERRLERMWCRVLGTEIAGLDDDFFASGGDSLLATQLVTMVQRELATALSLRDLFATPTLGTLAAAVQAGQRDSASAICRSTSIDERNAADLLANLSSLTDAEVVELAVQLETEELAREKR